MTRALIATAAALIATAPAWADHGGGLGTERMSPLLTALVWAGAALLVGLAVVAIVAVVTRRDPAEPNDG